LRWRVQLGQHGHKFRPVRQAVCVGVGVGDVIGLDHSHVVDAQSPQPANGMHAAGAHHRASPVPQRGGLRPGADRIEELLFYEEHVCDAET